MTHGLQNLISKPNALFLLQHTPQNNIAFLFFLLLFLVLDSLVAQVKIGDNYENVSPFSLLELESSTRGFLLPRMTTAQRDQAFNQNTPEGMIIYNTDLQMLQFFFYPTDSKTGEKMDKKIWNTAGEEVFSGSVPDGPLPADLFYNKDDNVLYAWDDDEELWIPLNLSSSEEKGVDLQQGTS